MKLSEVVAALPKLNQQELLTIRAACDQLIKIPVDDVDETNPLFDDLTHILGVKLSFRDFHNVTAYSAWKRHAPGVVEFITEQHPDVSKVLKGALVRMLLEALRDDLRDRGIPVTLGTMAVNLDQLPEVYDRCFPGFRQAGMQRVIEQAMERRR